MDQVDNDSDGVKMRIDREGDPTRLFFGGAAISPSGVESGKKCWMLGRSEQFNVEGVSARNGNKSF